MANSSSSSPSSPKLSAATAPTTLTTQNNIIPSKGNLISLNALAQIPFKLSKGGGNYASWKSQMKNLLFGYGLLGYVDGTLLCPPNTD